MLIINFCKNLRALIYESVKGFWEEILNYMMQGYGEIVTYPLVSVEQKSQIFNALISFSKPWH